MRGQMTLLTLALAAGACDSRLPSQERSKHAQEQLVLPSRKNSIGD